MLLALCGPVAAGPGAARSKSGLTLPTRQESCRHSACLAVLAAPARAVGVASGARPCLGRVCLVGNGRPAGAVELLRPARYHLRLDRAAPWCGLDQVRRQAGADGAGVWVALVDTGIDWRHPDFIDEQGHTRVAWLLDQTLPATGAHPELEQLGAGAVYSGQQLQAALDGELSLAPAGRDSIGHGTHVAGIVASDDAAYRGAAPAVELVVVKAIDDDQGGFGEDDILRGLAFADTVARRAGRPLVVNLSLGNQLGAHDGSEPLELALADLARQPGRAVVVAAGNEGDRAFHARAALTPSRPLRLGLQLPAAATGSEASVLVDIWAESAIGLRLVVEDPAGGRTSAVSSSGPHRVDREDPSGNVTAACSGEVSPFNGLWRCQVEILGQGGQPPAAGVWTLELAGSGARIDAWIAESDLGGAGPAFQDHVDPSVLVGPPATAAGVLAVGSFTNRVDWRDAAGRHQLVEGRVGELSWFSVLGPTRDGRPKPELLAPGWLVASTLSADSDPRRPDSLFFSGGSMRLVLADGRHALAGGTSMAAPLAAGVAALVLQQRPNLSGRQVTRRLSLGAAGDDDTGRERFRPDWGFGRLWAPATLAGDGDRGPIDEQQSLCGLTQWWMPPAGDDVWACAVPRDGAGRPLGEGLVVEIGAAGLHWAGPVVDLGGGLYARRVAEAPGRGRQVTIGCSAGNVSFSARPHLQGAASYQEAFAGGLRGGGCSLTPAGRGVLVVWSGLVGMLLVLSWFRRSRISGCRSRCSLTRSSCRRQNPRNWG